MMIRQKVQLYILANGRGMISTMSSVDFSKLYLVNYIIKTVRCWGDVSVLKLKEVWKTFSKQVQIGNWYIVLMSQNT